MSKFSTIATQTKQNVDYMPYVISVITSEELQKLGMISLREALTMIPGVDVSVGMAGIQTPIFRGSNPYAVGQSKMMIDGVLVNDQLFGGYAQFLDMPIEIIERIEVVRGPGSIVSHVNGYSGSINVITKSADSLKGNNYIFTSFGSSEYINGGFVTAYKSDKFSFRTNFFYQEHDEKRVDGPDRFGDSGEIPLWLKNYAFGINADYGNFYLKGRFSKNDNGVSYGQSFSITEDLSDYLNLTNNFIEAGYKFDIHRDLKADLSAGYFDEWRELQNKVMPDNSTMMMTTYPNGVYFLVNYTEQTFYERLNLTYTGLKDHKLTTGLMLSQSVIKDNTAKKSTDDMQTFNVSPLLSNKERKKSSLYLEDLYNLSESTSLQFGAKFDHYNDVKDQFNPRLAIVHRYDDKNIYKLMYTTSYREPSWREQYLVGAHYFNATGDIKPESVDAYEASYIHKLSISESIKFNAFYLENKDQIHAQNSTRTFENSGDNELYGFEAELKLQPTSNDQFYINYSYVDGSNTSDTFANTAQNMVKAYYVHQLGHNIYASAVGKFVGDKKRLEGDSREDVKAYTVVDVTLGYLEKSNGLHASFTIKNLFNETYYLPAPPQTYVNDFKQEGTSFLFKLGKKF